MSVSNGELNTPAAKEEHMETRVIYRLAGDLTRRENDVAQLVADGLRTHEIAVKLGIAPQTVKSHLKVIFDKCRVRNRVELTRLVLGFPVVARGESKLTAAQAAGAEDGGQS